MQKNNESISITPELIESYEKYLEEQEKSTATISKYITTLTMLHKNISDTSVTKSDLINWKRSLTEKYAAASVNSMIAAVNSLLEFAGYKDLKIKPLKIQKSMFSDEEKELTKEEYIRLVKAAEQEGNERLSLVIQTICSTGIRVSELKFITVQSVKTGKTEINNKGKRRIIFLPAKLRQRLKKYLHKQKITAGAVFITKNGNILNRSNIWRDMKALCHNAGVEPQKVFPHNLRHLFARTYYSIEKDLSRLADILGHSNVNTTRIYTMESGNIHARQIERMGLIIT